jgi:CarboxypepD_reg-like domain/TonB-dependent Receptor Plug Domain
MTRIVFICALFNSLLFVINIPSGFSQQISIKGFVTDKVDGEPLVGATVILKNSNYALNTDVLGTFHFRGITKGRYTLVVSLLSYKEYQQELFVSENKELKILLQPTSINLAEVTVSPTKAITQSESFTELDKQLRPINSAQDLLRLVPGLFIAQHAGGGKAEQIFLRGFDCDHGTDFNISVDGMPVNMVSHAHGQGYADFHFVIPETVDRLKVYKGPYSTRFGDFATSGTGEFFTKNAIEKNEINIEAGMFDTYRALAMVKLFDKKHLFSKHNENVYVAGEYVFSNSYFDKKQKLNRYNLFAKYSGILNSKNYLTFSASTFYANWDASGQIPQRAVDSGIITRLGSIDPSEGGETNRTNINALLTTTTNNRAILKSQLYYVNYLFNLYSNFSFYLNDPIHGDAINQTDQRNIFGYTGSYQKDIIILDKTIHTTAGIGTRNDLTNIGLKHAEKRTVLSTLVSGKVTQQNTYSFLDFTLDINKHFSVNAGCRLDYFRFNFKENKVDSLSGTKAILRPSPKLNFYYSVNERLQFFMKSGIGFHSNDARVVVISQNDNTLPKAFGSEIGSEFKLTKRMLVNIAIWQLYLQSELIYSGDEGTISTNNPTQRFGTDISIRYQCSRKLFADVDLNYNYGRITGLPNGQNYIPLAPRLSSIGGLTFKQDNGINMSLRYRFIDSRPANEKNSVTAKGYFLLDAVVDYKISNFEFGVSAENLLNTVWNQAQFDTESRLFNEPTSVSELHFTPGTPFFLKGNISFCF